MSNLCYNNLMKKIMLYIHIPFCEKKCNYCDFVSFPAKYNVIDTYIKQLITEIENKAYLSNDYTVSSIYIGGGTPSSIDKKYIHFILESVMKYYKVDSNAEISIEVNPNSAAKENLKVYFESGINRLSIGLQSANDNELKILGRIHNYNDFLCTYNDALHVGFKNINVDIMNGIPYQTNESYKYTLKRILSLNIKHISIYNLIIENGTTFFKLYNTGKLHLPSEDTLIDMDKTSYELTDYHGLKRYEISNYAKEHFECIHNLGYWSDIPYLGFGLNSSSYFENKRLKNLMHINNYLSLDYKKYLLDSDKNKYYESIEFIDIKTHISEYVMLGFRKTAGINIVDFNNTFNENFEKLYDKQITKYLNLNLLCKNGENYHLTFEGLNISNKILADFLV